MYRLVIILYTTEINAYCIVLYCIVLYCIPLLYKLTERNLYYIQVALPTSWICKVHVFGYSIIAG